MAITFYAKEGCVFCVKLEDLLKSLKLPYTKIVLKSQQEFDHVKLVTKMNTFPMVLIDDEVIGGFTEFRTLLITNQLGKKLNDW